jgi:hypothetical protein
MVRTKPAAEQVLGARVPGMGVNYRDETNPTEPMVVTVA